MVFFVYLLQCGDDSLYCGYAKNVDARVALHRAGRASKYTRSRLPVKVVHVESFPSQRAAMCREAEIKMFSRKKKLELIRAN